MAPALHQELSIMLAELESHRLEVALVPCRYELNLGGCVRVAISKNAPWYRQFCARHASSRRRRNAAFDTRIKRQHTIRVLMRLLSSTSRSIYAGDLLAIAERRLARASAAAAA